MKKFFIFCCGFVLLTACTTTYQRTKKTNPTPKITDMTEELSKAQSAYLGKDIFALNGATMYERIVGKMEVFSVPYLECFTVKNVDVDFFTKDREHPTIRLIREDRKYIPLNYPSYELPKKWVLMDGESNDSLYIKTIKEDKLEKTKMIRLDNVLKTTDGQVFFNPILSDKKLYISLKIIIDDWMFAENATLYIDGKKTVLNIGKADRDVYETYKVKVSEDFFFPITKTLLKQISQGKEVALRITGKKGMIDAYFSSQNLYNLKKFYDEELK